MLRHVFCGIQRSGNHAFINWYLAHLDNYVYWNNISDYGKPEQAREEGEVPFDHFVCSYENIHPFMLSELDLETELPYIVLRDPYNWYASAYNFFKERNIVRDRGGGTRNLIPLYLELYKYVKTHPDKFINYNSWVTSPDYRRELEKRFDLCETDETINIVASYGGGSTFDKFDYANCAQKMKLFQRWELVKDEPEYLDAILSYPIFIDISKELFDFIPDDCIFNPN